MKKNWILFLLVGGLVLSSGSAFAQYEKGDKLLNIGIGVNSYYNGGIPFGASFEVGVTDEISVGGSVDYLSHNYGRVAGSDWRFTAVYIGARGSYHFSELLNLKNEKIDLYGGLALGYRSFTWSDSAFGTGLGSSYGSGVYLGIYAAGRYYFSEKVGAFLELGAVGSTNAKVGVAFKF
ncbi:MAG: hypothetical protein M9954_08425 [Cyclobacteriaceae bacterium]|nr:hypothetical protein [Cyclobacteriaceae bacterium]MCB0498406.1 hypothetical protein [Cyclobacteriaceae bacterium]MCB9237024.1 hypothetical protein [Flammeovirgaceae bacterium]MCO5271670.1 hypothetical protein [Cyclobacteriaceae bacterium]MCW5901266.1 hypothetical protein [Cyclobacteriaceae bacterium]